MTDPRALAARFDEVRKIVEQIERHDDCVICENGSVFIGNPRKGVSEESCTLWQRLRAEDRATLIEYLELSGKTELPSHLRG